jgi:hypothetical protein
MLTACAAISHAAYRALAFDKWIYLYGNRHLAPGRMGA